jgi:hypothetical protein
MPMMSRKVDVRGFLWAENEFHSWCLRVVLGFGIMFVSTHCFAAPETLVRANLGIDCFSLDLQDLGNRQAPASLCTLDNSSFEPVPFFSTEEFSGQRERYLNNWSDNRAARSRTFNNLGRQLLSCVGAPGEPSFDSVADAIREAISRADVEEEAGAFARCAQIGALIGMSGMDPAEYSLSITIGDRNKLLFFRLTDNSKVAEFFTLSTSPPVPPDASSLGEGAERLLGSLRRFIQPELLRFGIAGNSQFMHKKFPEALAFMVCKVYQNVRKGVDREPIGSFPELLLPKKPAELEGYDGPVHVHVALTGDTSVYLAGPKRIFDAACSVPSSLELFEAPGFFGHHVSHDPSTAIERHPQPKPSAR